MSTPSILLRPFFTAPLWRALCTASGHVAAYVDVIKRGYAASAAAEGLGRLPTTERERRVRRIAEGLGEDRAARG